MSVWNEMNPVLKGGLAAALLAALGLGYWSLTSDGVPPSPGGVAVDAREGNAERLEVDGAGTTAPAPAADEPRGADAAVVASAAPERAAAPAGEGEDAVARIVDTDEPGGEGPAADGGADQAAANGADVPQGDGAGAAPAFDLVRVEADGSAIVAGKAGPGDAVILLLDGAEIAEATADDGGSFVALTRIAAAPTPRVLSLLARGEAGERRSESTVIVAPVAEPKPGPTQDVAGGETATDAVADPSAADEDAERETAGNPGAAAAGAEGEVTASAEGAADGTGTGEGITEQVAQAPLEAGEVEAAQVALANPTAGAVAAGDLGEEIRGAEGSRRAEEEEATAAPGSLADIRPGSLPVVETVPSEAPVDTAAPTTVARGTIEGEQPAVQDEVLAGEAVDAAREAGPVAAMPEAPGTVARLENAPLPLPASETGIADVDADPEARGRAEAGEPTPQPILEAQETTPVTPQAVPESAPAASGSPQLLVASKEGLRVLQPSAASASVPLRVETIGYEEGGVTLAGRGDGGPSDLRIYLDNAPVAEAPLSREGSWAAELEGVAPGTYTLRVDQIGADGSVTSRFETPFLRESEDALARTTPAKADPETLEISVITVQPGYSLWAIASDRYGDGMAYHKVLEANAGQIRDPDLIYPGQVFDLPE